MTDLEQRLRDALEDEGRTAPAPHETGPTLRRVRRRQFLTVVTSVVAVVGIVAVGFVGFGAIAGDDGGIPATTEMTTGTLNGISITYPQGWALIDPDAAGLNSGLPEDTHDLPRLVLMLAAEQADGSFGCPEPADGETTFLMSVQQEPLALQGGSAAPWPAVLEPMGNGPTAGGCYGGWEFQQAVFTTQGRSFDVRIGFAPDVAAPDRDALLEAYASMTFEPGAPATTVTLASGYVGDDDWSLTASRESDGLELSVSTSSGGAGIGGMDPQEPGISIGTTAVGGGEDAMTIVFGAVPAEATRIEVELSAPEPTLDATDTLDVPDDLDPSLNAFVIVLPTGAEGTLRALSASGEVVATGRLARHGQPVGTPVPGFADGRHFGFITAVDPGARKIEFDLAYFLTGEEANRAYQEATDATGPVPNDYYVVNDNPRLRKLTLAPDARLRLLDWNRCCDTFFDGDLAPFAEAIAARNRVEVNDRTYEGSSSWWITVEDGLVTEIEEQYTP